MADIREATPTTRFTSSGTIRNADKPRVGVTHHNQLADWFFDEVDQGIDLSWEEFEKELNAKVESGEMSEGDAQKERDGAEFDSRTVLIGSWKENDAGEYSPDESGEFAAIYNSGAGTLAVEWSKTTIPCHHTSPCFVMMNGDGPCGDLDTFGDAVLAYSLPLNWYRESEIYKRIPADHPVKALRRGEGVDVEHRATCLTCGLSWDDGASTSMTPTPSGRCPFESWHE